MGNLAFELGLINVEQSSPFDENGNVIELGESPFTCYADPIERYLNSEKANLLYFIQVAKNLVKIGSASNVPNFYKRLEECSRWVSNPKVLGVAFCDRRVEKHIHSACSSYHVKTKGKEIFSLEYDIKKSIALWSEWSIYGSLFGNTEESECECVLEDFLQNPLKFYCELNGIDENDLEEDMDDFGRKCLSLKTP